MVRSNLNEWFQRTTHFMNTFFLNPIVSIFHNIIGKNNNVNLADFGTKFTIMINSLYYSCKHWNVHVYSCIATTQNKIFKTSLQFPRKISSFDDLCHVHLTCTFPRAFYWDTTAGMWLSHLTLTREEHGPNVHQKNAVWCPSRITLKTHYVQSQNKLDHWKARLIS